MWTGPTNDSSKFGAGDIAGTFGSYGDVGISLKAGKGQLKNLTITSFFKALGVPLGTDGQAKTHFLEKYKSNWDAMTKDWVRLEEKEFNQHKLTALLINIIENRDDYLNKKNNLEKFCYQNTWNKINEKVISSLNEN